MNKTSIYTCVLFLMVSITFLNAQAFSGKGDQKFQVGPSFQSNATSINATYDVGVGENISLGLSSSYALNISEGIDAGFDDRFDIKARFNANIGNVLNFSEAFDLYPGLNLSLKNFGGHVGARYFFSTGFGIFTEFNFPIAKYNSDTLSPAEKLFNQTQFSFGASFNL